MKKRCMLALASLAAGFVVAAVTPSHASHATPLGPDVTDDTLGTFEQSTGDDSFAFAVQPEGDQP
jgi:hypothetical protein